MGPGIQLDQDFLAVLQAAAGGEVPGRAQGLELLHVVARGRGQELRELVALLRLHQLEVPHQVQGLGEALGGDVAAVLGAQEEGVQAQAAVVGGVEPGGLDGLPGQALHDAQQDLEVPARGDGRDARAAGALEDQGLALVQGAGGQDGLEMGDLLLGGMGPEIVLRHVGPEPGHQGLGRTRQPAGELFQDAVPARVASLHHVPLLTE